MCVVVSLSGRPGRALEDRTPSFLLACTFVGALDILWPSDKTLRAMTRQLRLTRNAVTIIAVALLVSSLQLLFGQAALAQNEPTLAAKIAAITSRAEYRHATFGIEVYSLDENRVLFALRANELFTPASTTKLLTEGTALELLGADYRFHTRVYRTGPIAGKGTLKGNLILVASGDPNLSGRIQADGTLAFENEDHAYDGSLDTRAVPGDPLLVIREIAAQVASHGIKKIRGNVLVDASLFPEGQREDGTDTVISPVCVNDNLVDLTVSPGNKQGAPATVRISPETPYAAFINRVTTGAPGSRPNVQMSPDMRNSDGSHTVTLTGSVAAQHAPILYAYRVPEPSRFAEVALVSALREKGIAAKLPSANLKTDFRTAARSYTPENMVAEHVSPPLSEEIKVTLKVSQNLHASTTPFILGAVLGHKTADIDQGGFDLEHDFLAKAGLDLAGASQGDGAGGAQSAYFTPDFVVHYLAFMATRKDFAIFENALPILGRDGTLWKIQTDSPAAGNVFAKTGTFDSYDALNKRIMLNGKGLAGYMTTRDGRRLAFAVYANRVSLRMDDPDAAQNIVGQALGEIAGAIYSAPLE
jgi:PBP4 family serine-type D-alanyl-D-alanine carboxypeptidase